MVLLVWPVNWGAASSDTPVGPSMGFLEASGHDARLRDGLGQRCNSSECSIVEQSEMKGRAGRTIRLVRAAAETAVRATVIHNF